MALGKKKALGKSKKKAAKDGKKSSLASLKKATKKAAKKEQEDEEDLYLNDDAQRFYTEFMIELQRMLQFCEQGMENNSMLQMVAQQNKQRNNIRKAKK